MSGVMSNGHWQCGKLQRGIGFLFVAFEHWRQSQCCGFSCLCCPVVLFIDNYCVVGGYVLCEHE
jgi:hypothetical protein